MSLSKFSLAEPLVINTDNVVVGGNFRLRLLKKKEVEEIDVRVPDRTLTKEESEELNLRLNRNQGKWSVELLKDFNQDLLKGVGFEDEELDEIFGFEMDDEFDVAKELNKVLAGKERRCEQGDLWQLGEHRLYIGNSTDKKSWEKLLGDERFDFMFTDPPHKIGYGLGVRKQILS